MVIVNSLIKLHKTSLLFYIHGSVHRESNFIIVQQDATYSVYYIFLGSSTCFGCRHPSSGARTAVITASGTGQPGLLPSALVVELELIHVYRTHESVPTQQRERMVVDPVNQYQKL